MLVFKFPRFTSHKKATESGLDPDRGVDDPRRRLSEERAKEVSMSDFAELVSRLNEMIQEPGFIYGVAFFFVCEFWCHVFNLPFALLDLFRQRERQHECLLRCEGHIDAPCHYKACPFRGTCPHYKPLERWRFLSALRQRK